MSIFKIGDLVVGPPQNHVEYWKPMAIFHIINPDSEHCTLVCVAEDGDTHYLKLSEVVHYNPVFTKNEQSEKVNTHEIKVGDLVEVISKPKKEWADGMSIGSKFVVWRIGNNTEDVPEGVRSIHSKSDDDGYSYYFPESCVKLVEEDSFAICEQQTEVDAINPMHYKHGGIETIDYMKAVATKEEYEGHLRLTAIKYLSRFGKKGDKLEQAEKAAWYVNKLIESLGE